MRFVHGREIGGMNRADPTGTELGKGEHERF